MSGDGPLSADLMAQVRQSMTNQQVVLSGSDTCNSHAIYGRDVTIFPSRVDASREGSNKVKINQIVSYDWPVKHYKGQQVVIDKEHTYVAYALKGRTGGIVRLIHRQLAERALIKGYSGFVIDLAFSHSDGHVLASLDEGATLFVHRIHLDPFNHVTTTCLIQLSWPVPEADMRLFWCCYIPGESSSECEDDEDKSLRICTVIGPQVYVFNIEQLSNEHGTGPHQYTEIAESIVNFDKHREKVTAAAFSPDGSAIATASEDGVACFFDSTCKCIHRWEPHGGQPISMLYFLDDLTNLEPSVTYWKYVLTATKNNTELKIWSCNKWQCVQTVRFVTRGDVDPPCLIANLDLTSRYLVMSDIAHRVIYVLKFFQDADSETVHMSSVSEFILGAPVLSFAIMDVRRKQVINTDSDDDDDDDDSIDELEGGQKSRREIDVHLAAVQPKHLQDMHITFTPVTATAVDSLQTTSGLTVVGTDSPLPPDALSDVSVSASGLEALGSAVEHPVKDSNFKLDPIDISRSKADSIPSTVSTDPGVELLKTVGSTSSTDSVLLSHPPVAFAHDRDYGTETETSTSSVVSGAAATSVLLTPDSFVAATSNNLRPAMEVLPSPGSGRSSLTHVTQLADNSSLIMGGFDGVTVSSVSPRSSASPSAGGVTPVSLASVLPPASVTSDANVESSTQSAEETARQLDELFASIHSNGSAVESPLPTMIHVPALTEDDLLNGSPIDTLAKSLSLPNAPLTTGALSPAPTSATYDTNIWPKPPDAPTQKSESGDTDESDTTDETSGSSSDVDSETEQELNIQMIERDVAVEAAGVSEPTLPSLVASGQPSTAAFSELSRQLEEMKAAVLTLSEQMMQQNKEIRQLKTAVSSGQKVAQLSKQLQALNSSVSNKLEQTTSSLKRDQKAMQERLTTQVSSKLSQEVKGQLERTVSAEMKRSIVPSLGQLIDPVKRDLHSVMAEKLTAADKTFKETLNKLFNSQAMIDKIGHSVSMAVQDVMHAAHKHSLEHQVLPSFDAAMKQSFIQLNASFSEGLNHYMKQMGENTDKLGSKQLNAQAVIMASCDSAVESLKQTRSSLTQDVISNVQREMQQQVIQLVEGVKGQLVVDVQKAVRKEVKSALDSQQQVLTGQFEAIRSAAATPGPEQVGPAIIKTQIERLLQNRDYEAAFQQALSASDLSLVLYLLQKIPDSADVMEDPCSLSQPTLLSLLQQLSHGLSEPHLDTKLDYIADAILQLDPQSSVTRQYISKILGVVKDKLNAFLSTNPSPVQRRAVLSIDKSLKSVLKYAPAE
ncbi:enhancer of mRNA-decapping protein 4-like isoform X2 [Watersipora subatra]|uniref:enhancer of mRNA-decapping protein 4-like isoform X2 n=1 Tax=Watersipora subatra TaxID=2589382 RepID=UPI00355C2E57